MTTVAGTPDLSSFLKSNFAERSAAPQKQLPVLNTAAQFDKEIQAFLDCHHDEYHLRKKKKNKRPSVYSSSPAAAVATIPSSPSPKPVDTDAPSVDAMIAMMMGSASVAPARPTIPAGSQQQAQGGSIRRLDDKQKLTSYPY